MSEMIAALVNTARSARTVYRVAKHWSPFFHQELLYNC